MCRTGVVYSQCACGTDLMCRDQLMCSECFDHWMDVDDSEFGDE